jgi:hypothetical protein
VLGQLTRKEETDSSLDLSRGDSLTLVVTSETTGLSGDALKDIIDERVHDSHGLVGDTSIGVNLLKNLRGGDKIGGQTKKNSRLQRLRKILKII